MELSVPERLAMLNLLPQQGNFVTLKLLRELREALSFTDEEVEKFKVKVANERITWDNSATVDREIEIGSTMTTLIAETLRKLDKAKQLTNAHMSLYEKFVAGED